MEISPQCPADAIIYTPVQFISRFPDHRLVVRSDDPNLFPEYLTEKIFDRVNYIRLTALDTDPSPLLKWDLTLPVDLVMKEPDRDFSRLYAFAPLLDRGPVRVTVTAAQGIQKAVRLAASLHFSVNIEPGQPNEDLTAKLIELADYYLKTSVVEEPIEFFHSLFFSFVNDEIITLWEIQEEDPVHCCKITDEGNVKTGENVMSRMADDSLFEECVDCFFRPWCLGFFKHPDPNYSCRAVMPLLRHLFSAAEEFKRDLATQKQRMP